MGYRDLWRPRARGLGGDVPKRTALAMLAVVLVLAAATAAMAAGGGGTAGGRDSPPSDRGGRSGAVGDGISVAQARGTTSGEDLLVKGWLIVDEDGVVRLCDELAESDPPQCAGASVEVEGLDPGSIGGLMPRDGVRWSQEQVRLLGPVQDGVLRVTGGATA